MIAALSEILKSISSGADGSIKLNVELLIWTQKFYLHTTNTMDTPCNPPVLDQTICTQGAICKAICTENPFVLDHKGIRYSDGSIIIEIYGRVKMEQMIDITKALNEAYKLGYEKDRWVSCNLPI